MSTALLTVPLTVSKCKVFFHPSTLMTGFGTGIKASYQLHIAPMLLRLVHKLAFHLEETGITHRCREGVISQHSLCIQIFQANQRIGGRKVRGHLVQGISSLIRQLIMRSCQFLFVLPPVATSLVFAG